MSRKKETIIFIVIILVLGFWRFGGGQQLYFSPEKVMYACEKGLHYGPSEKVLLKKQMGNRAIVIGKLNDGISVVHSKRSLLGMWKLGEGSVTGYWKTVDDVEAAYSSRFSLIYGAVKNKDIKTIEIAAAQVKDGELEILEEANCNVDDDGFFYANTGDYYTEDDGVYFRIAYIYGFDENSTLIYSYSY